MKKRAAKVTVARAQPRPQAPPKPIKVHKFPGLLSGVGGALGGSIFGPTGATLGAAAGNLISKITGFGDYQISHNTLANGTNAETVPTFSAQSDGVRIKHREYVADIIGNTTFQTQLDAGITPTSFELFPWLSQVAVNFETFRFEGLVFEYRSTSEFSTTNPALGTILMCGIYDVNKPLFTNKQALESYEYAVSIKPNMNAMMPIECRPSSQVLKNLLTGPQPAGTDKQFYALANLQVAAQGQPSAYTCGELWVTYDVLLQKPRIDPSPFLNTATYAFVSPTTAAPFGTDETFGKGNPEIVAIDPVTRTVLFLLPGQYVLSYSVAATTIGSVPSWGSLAGGCAFLNTASTNPLFKNSQAQISGIQGSYGTFTAAFKSPAGGSVVLTGFTLTTGTDAGLVVTRLQNSA
jgi:hypothetical protein